TVGCGAPKPPNPPPPPPGAPGMFDACTITERASNGSWNSYTRYAGCPAPTGRRSTPAARSQSVRTNGSLPVAPRPAGCATKEAGVAVTGVADAVGACAPVTEV